MSNKLFFSFIFSLYVLSSFAQTFSASIQLGGVFSQINGDDDAGFHKAGLHAGLAVSTKVRSNLSLETGITYSQKGSASSAKSYSTFKIKTDLIEIPLVLSLIDWEEEDFYRVRFRGGLVYGRLFKASAEYALTQEIIDAFAKNNISFLLGFTFYSSKHLGLMVDYQRAITPLYSGHLLRNNLLPNSVQMSLIYTL